MLILPHVQIVAAASESRRRQQHRRDDYDSDEKALRLFDGSRIFSSPDSGGGLRRDKRKSKNMYAGIFSERSTDDMSLSAANDRSEKKKERRSIPADDGFKKMGCSASVVVRIRFAVRRCVWKYPCSDPGRSNLLEAIN